MHCFKEHFKRFRPLQIVGIVTGGLTFVFIMAFLFGYFVMLLWNWLMPAIFGLVEITYWQAWGLVLLFHILFKFGIHPHREINKRYYARDEIRNRFKERFECRNKEDKTNSEQ
ncbi:MAG TPA: hypothetical protein VIH07_01530 [Candidatus Humimicrobiaceae bacterium]